jgi:hypothetical protein
VIALSDSATFRDVIHKLSQQSQMIIIEKTERSLEFSSISLDELCLASAIFRQSFFSKWDDCDINPVEVEPKSLYEISNLVQAKSGVQISLSEAKIKFRITDQSVKTIILTELRNRERARIQNEEEKNGTRTSLKTTVFLGIVKELSVVLDEIRLQVRKNSRNIIFRGRRAGILVEAHPREKGGLSVPEDIDIEFPAKHFQHFSPLFNKFEEISLSFSPKSPLKIEGDNGKWKFILVVSKIEKNPFLYHKYINRTSHVP